ncbi:MAG: SAM-dependent methyltransferase [Lachnospiraceae bacterium]|nr:SAM-dependent methyltransferase [Lachnospiraceae bacterium]
MMESSPYKIILSKAKNSKYRKIQILKKEKNYQVEKYTQKQVFHENISRKEVEEYLMKMLGVYFFQFNAWDTEFEYQLLISKKGKVHLTKKVCEISPKEQIEHNRKKTYLIPEGKMIEPLVDMGIFTKEGKIVRSMYDKYRQINRFVELVDDTIREQSRDSLQIVDFGCGKSYLTFVLYYYFTEVRGMTVSMTGLDLKEDVIEKCDQAAKKYGYKNLHFELGDISKFRKEEQIDMMITLHACDTATDYALYQAILRETGMIFSVPCCQHELNGQIKSEQFAVLLRHGLIKERVAALMTDAIRANLLEACGYKVDLLEFVDFSHTPKNLLIRAKKRGVSQQQKEERLGEVENLVREYHLEPTLYRLLKEEARII